MTSLVIALFAAILVGTNAGIITHSIVPLASSTTIQGPGAKSTIVGPDGSSISSSTHGGSITASTANSAAVVATKYVYPSVIPTNSYHLVHGYVPANLLPSYRTSYVSNYGIHAPIVGAPYVVYPEGSGIRGQYVHDFTEKFYDDGSYKGEIY